MATASWVEPHDLTILEISMVLTAEPVMVRFSVDVSGTTTAELEVPAEAIGVPSDLADLRRLSTEPRFQFPAEELETLMRAIRSARRGAREPVWLRLRRPWGYLPAVPWERLLQPALAAPLLRFPFLSLPPVAAPDQLRMVVCASSPPTSRTFPLEDLVDEVIDQAAGVADRMQVEVFTDAATRPRMAERLARRRAGADVRVHDPDAWTPGGDQHTSPWLRWMSDVLAGRSVDIVHVIAPGHASANYGALALPESPATGPGARRTGFIGAADLKAIQRQTGSWLLGLTVPGPGVNVVGLRLLAHRMAQQWTGPVLLYDPYVDLTHGLELGLVYPWLFGKGATAPRTPAMTLYCHPTVPVATLPPAHVRDAEQSRPLGAIRRQMETYTLAKGRTLEAIEGAGEAPAWVTANQRYLEQVAAALVEPSWDAEFTDRVPTGDEPAMRRGLQDALQFVSDVIERHADGAMDETGI